MSRIAARVDRDDGANVRIAVLFICTARKAAMRRAGPAGTGPVIGQTNI
jgi:hypothetical protein